VKETSTGNGSGLGGRVWVIPESLLGPLQVLSWIRKPYFWVLGIKASEGL